MNNLFQWAVMLPLYLALIGCAPDEPSVEQSEMAENFLVAKLDSIVVPSVSFEDITVDQAIYFVRIRMIELDSETNPTRKGVSFNIPKPIERDVPLDEIPADEGNDIGGYYDFAERRITFTAQNIAANDLLAEIARRGRFDVYLTTHGICMVREGGEPIPEGQNDVEILRVIRSVANDSGRINQANKSE